jgi:hypothetical protein
MKGRDGSSETRFANPKAEEMRVRARYRKLALCGKVRLPVSALKALVGPDCSYRLYGVYKNERLS